MPVSCNLKIVVRIAVIFFFLASAFLVVWFATHKQQFTDTIKWIQHLGVYGNLVLGLGIVIVSFPIAAGYTVHELFLCLTLRFLLLHLDTSTGYCTVPQKNCFANYRRPNNLHKCDGRIMPLLFLKRWNRKRLAEKENKFSQEDRHSC